VITSRVPEADRCARTGHLAGAASVAAQVIVDQVDGDGAFARFLPRSVTTQVTHHAACPVVVISGQR